MEYEYKQCALCGKEKSKNRLLVKNIGNHDFYICNMCDLKHERSGYTELLELIIEKNILPSSEIQIAKTTKEKMEYAETYSKVHCLRCNVPMEKGGWVSFEHAGGSGILGNLIAGSSSLYTLSCPKCGMVEFYVKNPD